MRSMGWFVRPIGLVVVVTLSLAGCSGDDDPSADSSDGASATESADPVVDGCEVEVKKSERVFAITTEVAEAALSAAGVEATSVDLSLEPGGTTCRITWEDAGKGGLLTIGTPGPGSSDLTGEPGAYDVGPGPA